jgi:hypothetical protein
MNIDEVIQILVGMDDPPPAYKLIELAEASVHLPRRGSIWMAAFRDERGKQVQRSTGQRDRAAAQAIADRLETEARRKRAAQPPRPAKPTIRVRPGSPERGIGLLSQKEVAVFLRISERAVRETERSAFEKIRNHPLMRQFWREWEGGEIDEAALRFDWQLSHDEIVAVYNLARTAEEREVLRKVMALMTNW